MIIMVIDPKKAEKLILANIVIRCATSLVKIFMNDLSSTTCSTVSTTRITNMTLGLLRHVEEPVDDLPSVILCYCWMKAKKKFLDKYRCLLSLLSFRFMNELTTSLI